MLNLRYNDTGSKGFLTPTVLEFFSKVVNDNERVSGFVTMSVPVDAFNLTASEGADFYTKSAVLETSPDASVIDSGAGLEGAFDAMVGRRFDGPNGPARQENGGTPAKEENANVNLKSAWNKAKGFQGQTVKLKAGDITASSGQGARRTGDQIKGKDAAVKELKGAVAQARKEEKTGPASARPEPSGGGGGLAKKAAVSLAAGAVADAVVPGASVAATVLAVGAGTFGAKGKSDFTSAADKGVYGTSAGHETVDVGGGMNGRQVDNMMAKGPGFGSPTMSQIRYGVEPALDGQPVGMDEKGLDALEATMHEMDQDLKLGDNMFKLWQGTDVDVTENIGGAPVTALKVGAKDEAALTSDKPMDSLSNPAIMNPKALV